MYQKKSKRLSDSCFRDYWIKTRSSVGLQQKGLARLCERLPRDFAEQIVDSVVDLFVSNVNDATWHGTCLCVAEMARRGLSVPSSLDRVIPWISRVCVTCSNTPGS